MPTAAGRKGGKLPRKKVNHTRVLTNENRVPLKCSQRVNIGESASNVNPCNNQQSTTNYVTNSHVNFSSSKFTCCSITKLQYTIFSMFSESILFTSAIWYWRNSCSHHNVSINISSTSLAGPWPSIRSFWVKFINIT